MNGYFVKLVRDRIPEMLGGSGRVEYAELPVRGPEHFAALKQKLAEEVGEYLISPTVEELVDVLEVVMCLGEVGYSCSLNELAAKAGVKRSERGALMKAVGMYATHPNDGHAHQGEARDGE